MRETRERKKLGERERNEGERETRETREKKEEKRRLNICLFYFLQFFENFSKTFYRDFSVDFDTLTQMRIKFNRSSFFVLTLTNGQLSWYHQSWPREETFSGSIFHLYKVSKVLECGISAGQTSLSACPCPK